MNWIAILSIWTLVSAPILLAVSVFFDTSKAEPLDHHWVVFTVMAVCLPVTILAIGFLGMQDLKETWDNYRIMKKVRRWASAVKPGTSNALLFDHAPLLQFGTFLSYQNDIVTLEYHGCLVEWPVRDIWRFARSQVIQG